MGQDVAATKPDDRERRQLLRLIEESRGSISGMTLALQHRKNCRDLTFQTPISRQGLTLHLQRHGLLEEAARARAASRIGGARPQLPQGVIDPVSERERLVALLALKPSYREVIAEMGISRRTFYRKVSAYAITPAEIERRRDSLKRSA
jgi:AraC-like DNA-binding protein